MTLNLSQLAAVNSTASRILCCAAAGSGKTRVLISRIQRMIADGIDPASIICLTFTNSAALEITKRLICKKCNGQGWQAEGISPPEQVPCDDCEGLENKSNPKLGFAGTLHGFLLRLLQQHGNLIGLSRLTVLNETEAEAMLVEAMAKLAYKGTRKAVDAAVALGIRHYRGGGTVIGQDASRVAFEYFHHMLTSGCVNFDMLLDLGLELVKKLSDQSIGQYQHIRQYEHLAVDEIQDANPTDMRIYDALPVKTRFFVGDQNQAIYGFRGGDVRIIQREATSDGTTVLELPDCYRCGSVIVEAANRLIYHNRKVTRNHMLPYREQLPMRSATGTTGQLSIKRYDTAAEELAGVVAQVKWQLAIGKSPSEVAILCRTNALASQFRKALTDSGVSVRQRHQQDNPLDWKTARAFIALLTNPENDRLAYKFLELKCGTDKARQMQISANSDFQTLNEKFLHIRHIQVADVTTAMVAASIERESVGRVRGLIELLQPGASLLELQGALAEMEAEGQEESEGITVCTGHASKGREWQCVFITAVEETIWPSKRELDEDGGQESRRLMYVAVTRAKSLCAISWVSRRTIEWSGVKEMAPSRFIAEIGGQP